MKPKLTAPQLRVLRLMRDGARLSHELTCDRWFLYGRYAESVRHPTITALASRGMISPCKGGYELTALGREAAKEGK